MLGTAYGVGVGPGDPELITVKALRVLRQCPVVAVPGNAVDESVAYGIAVAAEPSVSQKECVALPSPMTGDRTHFLTVQRTNASVMERYLDQGCDVAFLTLGDPSLYSTFCYLRCALEEDGYSVDTVAGVPSFCAVAARLKMSLAEADEPLHVWPGIPEEAPRWPRGNQVIMKAGSALGGLSGLLDASWQVGAVQSCGMEAERVFVGWGQMPEDASYLTTMLARNMRCGTPTDS